MQKPVRWKAMFNTEALARLWNIIPQSWQSQLAEIKVQALLPATPFRYKENAVESCQHAKVDRFSSWRQRWLYSQTLGEKLPNLDSWVPPPVHFEHRPPTGEQWRIADGCRDKKCILAVLLQGIFEYVQHDIVNLQSNSWPTWSLRHPLRSESAKSQI